MANQRAAFISGANAKIKIGTKVIAYCTDIQYNLTVATIPIEAIGTYEVLSNEPVAIMVEGSMSIVRYASNVGTDTNVEGVESGGNSLSNVKTGTADANSNLQHHFDKANILASRTFDVEIRNTAKVSTTANVVEQNYIKIYDCRLTRRSAALNKRGILVENISFVGRYSKDEATT